MAVTAHPLVGLWSIFKGVLLMFPNPRLDVGARILIALAGLAPGRWPSSG